MSLAAETRAAVRRHPFVLDGLRAGVVNYTAAARYLDVEGDEESVATALRRFAEELEPTSGDDRRASVRLRRGVDVATRSDDGDDPSEAAPDSHALLTVGDVAVVEGGELSAVHARGDVDARALETALGLLRAAEVTVEAAAVAGGELLVVAGPRSGADALRAVEDGL